MSNKLVLERARAQPFTEQLLLRQFALLGKVSRSLPGGPLRRDTVVDHTIRPKIGRFVRVVGRPSQDWTTFLLKEGTSRFGLVKFERLLADRTVGAQQRWVNELRHLFRIGVVTE